MLRVGLTGGVGSGKSEVSRLLVEHGAVLIDADRLAHEVVAPGTPGLAAVAAEFGPAVVGPGGELDRAAVADLVFADEPARRRLEAIVHPLVRSRAAALEAAAPPGSVVVHDIPLLVETGQAGRFDVVVVVDAPYELQLDRLTRLRGLSRAEAVARIAAQATREQRLAAADRVVVNGGSVAALSTAVDRLWAYLKAQLAAP
ncbi:MAG TPA: dephospho-CoA kinase [Nocardioidaceae bacterium]|nr:dephospho-CoA kinase [Nocardioidaceae bacterium]